MIRGSWLRFNRYEVQDKCIVPAPKARRVLYDPWSATPRPYEALADVLAARDSPHLVGEQPEVVAKVLAWCNRYGLLGTLLNRTAMLTLAPRWERSRHLKALKMNAIQQLTYSKICGGWQTQLTESVEGTQQPAGQVPSQWPSGARTAHALIAPIEGGAAEFESLDRTWGHHFPRVPEYLRQEYNYPAPQTPAFWKGYGEPIHEFVHAAYLLLNGIEAMLTPKVEFAPQRGALRLAHLASESTAWLEQQKDGSWELAWRAGSLLSALAMMAMQDIAGRTLRACEGCSRLFQTNAYQGQYCSSTCRLRVQKRRYRQNKARQERTRHGKTRKP